MVADRVTAIQETMMFEPRYLRHQTSDIRIDQATARSVNVLANFSVIEILPNELPRVLMAGRYLDQLERDQHDAWLYREKICVFDSVLVANSIVYPV